MFFRSIISLLFFFLFLLLVSFVFSPLIVLELVSSGKLLAEHSKIYKHFHSISQLDAFILNSMHGARQNINNFYGLLAIITLHTFSSIWTYVTRVFYIEDNKLVLLREGLATWRDLSILKPGMVMIPQHKLIIVSWSTLMTWYRIGQVRTAKYRSYKHLQTIRIAQTIRGNWLYFHNWTICTLWSSCMLAYVLLKPISN